MKPPRFEYLAPTELDEALEALAEAPDETRPLAGGQSLVPMMNFRLAAPGRLVDLNRVEELAFVTEREDGGLALGAMTRQRALERDPAVSRGAPLLAEAAPWIAHAQIRSRGTIGGSVAHADPAAELPAVLLTLGARVTAVRAAREGEEGPRTTRSIELSELFLGPFFTTLEPDELISEIDIPALRPGEATAFEEIARRRGDYAIVGVAARVLLSPDGTCREAAISLINAGATPRLAEESAAVLAGEVPDLGAIGRAAEAAAAEAEPSADMHGTERYRRHLVQVLTHRVLLRAAGRARERMG